MSETDFQKKVLAWYDLHGRKHLPWQQNITAYKVWLSEVMLQQTQVATVIPYFEQFLKDYPDIFKLASAPLDHVLKNWAGLGYYARARNLHRCAQIVVEKYQGVFPKTVELLSELPGIGRSTAGAIASMAYEQSASILDGNVKRVLCRYKAIEGNTSETKVLQKLWALTDMLTPKKQVREYTQAMMDLGALICTRTKPLCSECPLQHACVAFKSDRVFEFPNKKPKKVLPIKTTKMLLIENANQEILVYQRPMKGIWGGLWSLPELNQSEDILDWCYSALKLRIKKITTMTPFRHTFTHYHLDIHPVIIKTMKRTDIKTWRWCSEQNLQTLGLPKPVSYLLQQYLYKPFKDFKEQ